MANSGDKYVRVTDYNQLVFHWEVASQDIVGNMSYVKWTLKLESGAYGRISSTADKNYWVTVAGVNYSGTNTVGIANNATKTLASGTVAVAHNSDGTKTFDYNFIQDFIITFDGEYISDIEGSGSGTLPTIPRASTLGASNGTLGTAQTLTVTRQSTSFTHTITYKCGGASGTIATKSSSTSISWTPPLTLASQNTTGTTVSVTFTITTYNGTTSVGSGTKTITCAIPASVKPSLSVALEDITGVDDIYGSPVKSLSKIKITPTVTTAYGSAIASYSIVANGVTYNTATATTGFLTTAGDSKVTVTVKDKRGRSATWTYTMNVQDYTAPTVSKLVVRRCDNRGTEDDQGEYALIAFSAAISSVGSKNTATYGLRYKKSTDTAWTEVSLPVMDGEYTVENLTYIFVADGNYSYDVEVVATDRHSSTTRSTSVSTAFTLYNCHSSGTGWRFGGVADKEYTLQNDLALCQVGNSYAFQPDSFGGEKGYTLMALITLNTLNVNAPIVFTINRRGALCPMTVYVRFSGSSTTTDPDLVSITYEGDNFGAFMVKTATSTWKLYVDNTGGWSNPCLQSWYTTENQKARLTVTFPNEQVDGTEPSVLGTYYRATPAKMQSILDYVYPVGSIYISYSHVNPGTMFGGTWQRITNAFLWATDASGTIGQTGGEKTHTLTVAEMPSHNHGGTYTGNVASTEKDMVWYTNTGSNMTYAVINAGGGQAHNNMPPYMQVSMWRRTA